MTSKNIIKLIKKKRREDEKVLKRNKKEMEKNIKKIKKQLDVLGKSKW